MSDFSRLQTEDDAVASGDDSAGWEKEDERIRLQLDAKVITEDADDILEDADDAAAPYGPMQGTRHWVRRRRCWYPCLGRRNATHRKIEKEEGHWP